MWTKRNLGILAIVIIIIIIIVGFKSGFSSDIKQVTDSNDHFSDLEVSPQNASTIVLGASYIRVSEGAKVVTQSNRVIKDTGGKVNVSVAANRTPQSPKDLVPYMEGERVAELMKDANVSVIPAANVPCKKIKGNWYGPDDKGNFVFGVDPSKVGPLFAVSTSDPNTRIEVETHGMNVLVPEAIKDNASLVVGCGDIPGKAEAEAYMAQRGINCYAPCDRFTSSIMPYKGPGVILGGAAIRPAKNGNGAVIGGQPIAIKVNEAIVVQTTHKTYPDQYCDTPNRFFTNLQKAYGIKLNIDVVDANAGNAGKVVAEANKTGANIIGVRVETNADKKPVEAWLKSDKNHRAILFHSAAYDPGYSLFFEFPDQVTGQDPKPIFIKNTSESELEKRFAEVRSLWS